MRRRLIPVLILAEHSRQTLVTTYLDSGFGQWVESAHPLSPADSSINEEYPSAECRNRTYNSYPGMAGHLTHPRPRTDEGTKAGGAPWRAGSCVSRVADRTGSHGNSGGVGASHRDR